MIVNGYNINFNKKAVEQLTFDEFEKMCLTLRPFKELPKKERTKKIKEVYGNFGTNAKKAKGSKRGKDLHSSNDESDRRDSSAEQGADVGGESIDGEEAKAKVQESKVRSKKAKDEL